MQARQSGFTLVELVVVIAILGILAATALPRFIDMRTQAARAATDGVAGAISSAFSINYGAVMAGATGANGGVRLSVANISCNDAAGSVLQGGVPTGYAVTGAVNCNNNATGGACTVSSTAQPTQSATATLICTG